MQLLWVKLGSLCETTLTHQGLLMQQSDSNNTLSVLCAFAPFALKVLPFQEFNDRPPSTLSTWPLV